MVSKAVTSSPDLFISEREVIPVPDLWVSLIKSGLSVLRSLCPASHRCWRQADLYGYGHDEGGQTRLFTTK